MPRVRRPNDLYDFTGIVKDETQLALKIDDGEHPQFWLPKSQTEVDMNSDGTCTFTIPQWLAEEKKLV